MIHPPLTQEELESRQEVKRSNLIQLMTHLHYLFLKTNSHSISLVDVLKSVSYSPLQQKLVNSNYVELCRAVPSWI